MKCLINQEQKSFIQEFYPSHGSLYCSKRLGLTSKQVVWQAFRLKIKCDENVISKNCSASRRASMPDENSYKVEPTQFFDVVNPKIAYLLGLLWADGWVKKNGRFCVGISTVVDDFKDFDPAHPDSESALNLGGLFSNGGRGMRGGANGAPPAGIPSSVPAASPPAGLANPGPGPL